LKSDTRERDTALRLKHRCGPSAALCWLLKAHCILCLARQRRAREGGERKASRRDAEKIARVVAR
jgi:hypothetical protein